MMREQIKSNKSNNIKDISSPTIKWIIIIVCFALGILDMIMLRDGIASALKNSISESSLTAFALATVANFTALLWGMESGKHLQEKSINKYSIINFLIWVVIGIFYLIICTIDIATIEDGVSQNEELLKGLVKIFLLVILYSSTGITISAEAHKIFDQDVCQYRKLKKELKNSTCALADNVARIKTCIGILQKFDRNYESLKIQHNKIYASIYKAEEATMATIVGKTLEQNPEISPSEAHKIKDEVLKKRDLIDEKINNKNMK